VVDQIQVPVQDKKKKQNEVKLLFLKIQILARVLDTCLSTAIQQQAQPYPLWPTDQGTTEEVVTATVLKLGCELPCSLPGMANAAVQVLHLGRSTGTSPASND
jgi:hypothetical protein